MKPTVLSIIVAIACPAGAMAEPAQPMAAAAAPNIRIVLVGDSTVNDGGGWGYGFKQYLTTNAECINTAANGRSSKSFMAEGRWTNALALHGDYYLIQFGHNDEPGKGPDRETDPSTTYTQNLERYVDEARSIGAKPVLVTSLTRRIFDKSSGKLAPNLVPYVEAMKKVAAERKVPLVDLHALSVEYCEKIGAEETAKFNPTGKNGKPDTTHLNAEARVIFAGIVVDELRKVVPELAPYLRAEPVNPAATDLHYDAVVSADGSGTFTTVQAAIAAAPDDGTNWFTIFVKPGVYQGQFMIPKSKRHVRLIGQEMANTVLTWPYNVNDRKSEATYQFDPGMVVAANDFRAENLTIENTSGDHGQALALRVDADRVVFKDCRITGWQDTLMVNNGRQYFTNCYIAGRVDFIYGSATAVFDHCEIHSRNGGHVTAANTPQDQPYGFVFLNCKLTGDSQPWVAPDGTPANKRDHAMADLGRPWRPYASVSYINCWMGDHIKPEGWNNWRNPTNELTARYSEFSSTGPGANAGMRVNWAKQLTREEAGKVTVESVLGGSDGWNPAQL
jgi:pectinesterase